MSQVKENSGLPLSYIIHSIIGICIMFFGRYLPSPSVVVETTEKLTGMGFPVVDGGSLVSISPTGMLVVTIFFGVIYLWTFVDTLWPSFLGIFVLGISSYAPMPQIINQFWGNPQAANIFLVLIFATALIKSQASVYLARFLLTRSFIQGRPWMLTAMLLFTCYAVASLDQTSAVFIMLPVFFLLFNEVGMKKGDAYVSFMVVGGFFMIVLNFCTDAIKGGAFLLLSSLYGLSSSSPELNIVPINAVVYLLFGFIISAICLVSLLALMRFVFRVDVTAIKNFDTAAFAANPLPPMSWKQKAIVGLFLVYVVWMLTPSILGVKSAIGGFVQANLFGGSLALIFLLTVIHYKGEPLANFGALMGSVPWKVFFLIATAMLMGGAMTSPATQVPVFLESALKSIFTGFSFTTLAIASAVLAILVTNFFNSVVIGLILAPVLAALCVAYGFDPMPLLACFFFTVLMGLIIPPASPFAALLYDNQEWISQADIAKYATIVSVLLIVVMSLVGVPLAMVLF